MPQTRFIGTKFIPISNSLFWGERYENQFPLHISGIRVQLQASKHSRGTSHLFEHQERFDNWSKGVYPETLTPFPPATPKPSFRSPSPRTTNNTCISNDKRFKNSILYSILNRIKCNGLWSGPILYKHLHHIGTCKETRHKQKGELAQPFLFFSFVF